MQIVGLSLRTIALPERRVFRYRGGVIGTKRVIVQIETDGDLVGIGEATPIPTDWGHDVEAIHLTILQFIAPALIGMDPFDLEGIWARVARSVSIDQVPTSMLVERAGVDAALYDLMGKAAGVPVSSLLGGGQNASLPTAAVIGLDTPDQMAEHALEAQRNGFFDFKLKVGVDPVMDLQRVATLRDALGPTARIRVDANGGWSANEAITLIRRMEKFDLELVEQPVPGWDLPGLAFVRGKVDTPIMVDESLHSIQDALALAAQGACDLFNVKYQRLGGITPARKILHIAEAAGIRCMLGGELESGVGTAAGLHLMASSPLFTIPADLVGPSHFADDILVEPFTPVAGHLAVPKRPGLGVSLDADKMHRYAVQLRTVGMVADELLGG
jgi:L-Ala-D/L-Glu epimerase